MTDNVNMDIDALLDGTLDDLADMPEFKPFPIGTHRVKVKMEVKEVQGAKAVEVNLVAKETVELPSGSTDAPLAEGDSTNLLLFLSHKKPQVAEMGQGQFKEIMKTFAAHFGPMSNRELMAQADGNLECLVVTGQRFQNKGKPDQKVFTSIEALEIV